MRRRIAATCSAVLVGVDLAIPASLSHGFAIMLSGIKSFFAKNVEPAPAAAPEQFRSQNVPIAACALMLELAHADDEFDVEERAHLERALARHFDIPPAKVKE